MTAKPKMETNNLTTEKQVSFDFLNQGGISLNSLQDLPEHLLMLVMLEYPRLLCYVRAEKQTTVVVYAALKSNALALEYAIDQELAFCMFAVDRNIEAFFKIKNPQPIHQVFCVNTFLKYRKENYERVKAFEKRSMVKKRSIIMDENESLKCIKRQPEIIHYFKEITDSMIRTSMQCQIQRGGSCDCMLFEHIQKQPSNLNTLFVMAIKNDGNSYKLLIGQGFDLSFFTKFEWLKLNPSLAVFLSNVPDFKEIMKEDIKYIRYYPVTLLTKEHCIHYLERLFAEARDTKRSIKSILDEIIQMGDRYPGFSLSSIREICERANMDYSWMENASLNLLWTKLDKNNPLDLIKDDRPEYFIFEDLISLIYDDNDDNDLGSIGYISYLELESLLSYDGLLIGLIKDQTERLIKVALTQNPLALEFVRVQTMDICKMALTLDKTAAQFVRWDMFPQLQIWSLAKFGLMAIPSQTF